MEVNEPTWIGQDAKYNRIHALTCSWNHEDAMAWLLWCYWEDMWLAWEIAKDLHMQNHAYKIFVSLRNLIASL